MVGLAFESNKSLQMIKAEADEFQGINTRQDLSGRIDSSTALASEINGTRGYALST